MLLLTVKVASVASRGVYLSCGVESATALMVSATAISSAYGKSRHDIDVNGLGKEDVKYHLHGEENKTNP